MSCNTCGSAFSWIINDAEVCVTWIVNNPWWMPVSPTNRQTLSVMSTAPGPGVWIEICFCR